MKEPFLATVLNTIMGRDITNKLYALNDRVKVSIYIVSDKTPFFKEKELTFF